MMTIYELFCYAMLNSESDVVIQLTVKTLATLSWFSQSVGVQRVCERHDEIMADMRKRADACRYRAMAHEIIGDPVKDRINDMAYDATKLFEYEQVNVKVLECLNHKTDFDQSFHNNAKSIEPREPDI